MKQQLTVSGSCHGFNSLRPSVTNMHPYINSMRLRQNGRHFTDDIFKCIFLNENVWIPIKISSKFVCQGPINNIPALVQIMAWRWPGNKPLSRPMMVSLPMHICVIRPQWVNIGPDNGLAPGRRQAIIWPNETILLIQADSAMTAVLHDDILQPLGFFVDSSFVSSGW